MNKKSMEKVRFRYHMTYDEVYEAFYLILDRRGSLARYVVSGILGLISACCIWGYAKRPENLTYSFLAFICAVFMLWLLGGIHIKAKKGAKRVYKNKGMYEVEIRINGYIYLNNNSKIKINGDKNSSGYETENIFALRTDREHTFCLPKRMMNLEEQEFVRNVLEENVSRYKRK